MLLRIFTACVILTRIASAASPIYVVTGATGGTGLEVYKQLVRSGVTVRAFVRSVSKARKVLNCTKCDASEGIFVGDVKKKETMKDVMAGATSLAIATSAGFHCEDRKNVSTCHFPKGGLPIDVDYHGGKNEIEAFAEGRVDSSGGVVLVSMQGTTDPEGIQERFDNAFGATYKLNEEAFLMSSGLRFTIVKPCGLTDDAAGQREILVGHDDSMPVDTIPRADVARVMVKALFDPSAASGLRFDMCSRKGAPTTDINKVFEAAKYPWQKSSTGIVV